MAANPFRSFPSWDCLSADPWREQATAQADFDQLMKHREKEENRQFASMGFVTGLAAEINETYRQLRDLEDQLRREINLPYRPYFEEEPSNWN